MGVFLNSVRPIRSSPFDAFPFWVIFCRIMLERSWVIGFCLHFCWMYVATAITYCEQSPSYAPAQTNGCNRSSCDDFSNHLFQNDTNGWTWLITCHHCISFTVALAICKLQRILKGFTSLAHSEYYFNDADNAMCKSRVGFSVLPVAERTIFDFGCKRTIGSWIHACNTTMQYGFVLHCCDVMALCTAS